MIDYKMGWKKQPEDERDLKVSVSRHVKATLPPYIDLTASFPPCFDQGQLSSCTANSISAAILFDEVKEKRITPAQAPVPSRLFIYYSERLLEECQNEDAGAIIRDGVKVCNSVGFPPESIWPYIESKVNAVPSPIAYSVAAQHKIKVYRAVPQTSDDIRGCLALGYPVIFGFTVFSNINETEKTGILTMPSSSDTEEGGHACLICGYSDERQMFKVRNSWGVGFGIEGYFYMPYEYVLNKSLAADFWVISSI